MSLLPTSFDWFTLVNGLTSIVGFLISIWTLLVAKSVKRRVDEVKSDLIARVRTDEIVNDIARSLPQLARALSSDRVDGQRASIGLLRAQLQSLVRHAPGTTREECTRLEALCRDAMELTEPLALKAQSGTIHRDVKALLVRVKSESRDRHLGHEP